MGRLFVPRHLAPDAPLSAVRQRLQWSGAWRVRSQRLEKGGSHCMSICWHTCTYFLYIYIYMCTHICVCKSVYVYHIMYVYNHVRGCVCTCAWCAILSAYLMLFVYWVLKFCTNIVAAGLCAVDQVRCISLKVAWMRSCDDAPGETGHVSHDFLWIGRA